MTKKLLIVIAIIIVGLATLVIIINDKKASVLVVDPQEKEYITVDLYYHNTPKDKEIGGGYSACSDDSVLPVKRKIPKTITPIKDTLELLLKGELTSVEKAQGFDTEFPLAGFSIDELNLKDSTILISFIDAENKANGGSCRTGILSTQIRKTALQFPEVKKVKYVPEDRYFQP